MPIPVTCPGCHTRFNVNDRFAGKEGPCPKCKTKILIPKEAVIIHAPEHDTLKDSQGRPVVKPIKRVDTSLSSVHIALIAVTILGFFLAAIIMRMMVEDKSSFPSVLVWVSAVILAPPIVFAAYTFLRDPDLGRFSGNDLWARIAICSAIYAALWFAMPVAAMAFDDNYELGSWSVALVGMLAAGGAIAMLVLDLDYIMGLVHYGMYLGICLIGRLIVGIGTLPGMLEESPETVAAELAPTLLFTAVKLLGC